MSITWNKALYDAAYDSNGRHFERDALYHVFERRAVLLIQALGLDNTHRVVIFGTGFGWTDEALRALDIDAVGADVSPHVQMDWEVGQGPTGSNKKPLNHHGLNNGSRNIIRREFAGNNNPTHVISEDILTGLSDAEVIDLAGWDDFTDAMICHITHTNEDSPDGQAQTEWPLWNWKSEVEWRTLFNTNGMGHHRLFRPGDGLEEF